VTKKIVLYNTLDREKVEFIPLDPGGKKVGIYTCGPTVYNFAHIGNLRTYVFEDILKRTLRFYGYEINHVMNITDVGHLTGDSDSGQDKMEDAAHRNQQTVWDLAKKYTEAFQNDIRLLNIQPPNVWCRATDHIPQQIALVQQLEKLGFTYTLEDGIYYDTSKFPNYSKFARLDVKNLEAGARVEMVQGKRHPTDFALWKFSPKDGPRRQMEWDSPWGIGFPGWHIECSAMSMYYLGQQFDIHCGGIDHVPIHHTNEIAQVEAVTQRRWVNYWLHGEFLLVQKKESPEAGRMGKSEGNFLTLPVLMSQNFHPLAYRYFLLNAHYRKQLVYSQEAMQAAQNGFMNLQQKVMELKQKPLGVVNLKRAAEYHEQFVEAVYDDLNIPNALAVLWTMLDDKGITPAQKLQLIAGFDLILGLDLGKLQIQPDEIPESVQQLVQERLLARQNKNWAEADRIRNEIKALGFDVLDGKDGCKVKKLS